MDGEGDQYEERLREVFQSFDGSGAGSLNPEELAELCHALQLSDTAIHKLLDTLLDSQDQLAARVEFEQFKNALILVLSSTEDTVTNEENTVPPESPEVQPRFVKGGKRYGRRSTPEFTHAISELSHAPPDEEQRQEALGENDGALPSKRERWNANVSSPEEYEAEGQLHLWNPDEPSTPRGSMAPLSGLEERLQIACEQLSLPLNGMATLHQLHILCQHLGLELGEDAFQSLGEECMMGVQDFVSYILNKNKPPTPSASTPYRQLKRHHSMQPFDETGRRISSVLSSTIGLRLFSGLDDGTGHTAVEQLLDTWLEEGVDNSPEILQALDFSLDGKVNLSELTAALENELLVTKNSIHQAALVSFKAEIRHLLERVDLELREKEKIRSDLEKAEKLKSQLASDVDEHHSAIERINDLNLRKLEQEHKDRMVALRADMSKEMELVQQQANQQREELEQEIRRIREDENFIRDHLTLTIKENGRLEAQLLDSTERFIEAETQLSKLQRNLDSVLKEKFGDLDLNEAEFYQQEERMRQLRSSYEKQCLELQDRIDELQAQSEEFRALGRAPQTSLMPSLSDELDSKSPGMESDQGLGSEEGQPFNMSLEAEMMLEQLKEQHVRDMENIRAQLDSTLNKCQHKLEEQKAAHEEENSLCLLQHQKELQKLREEAAEALDRARALQEQLEQGRHSMKVRQDAECAELRALHQQELSSLSQEVQDARSHALQLEEQLRKMEERSKSKEEELSRAHAEACRLIELQHKETLAYTVQAERERLQFEKEEAEKRLTDKWEREKQHLEEIHKEVFEGMEQTAEGERVELERRLEEKWEREKQQLEESNKAALQTVLEEELVRLLKEQDDRERKLMEQWKEERSLLEEQHTAELCQQIQQERKQAQVLEEEAERKRMEKWEREKAQLQKQHDEVLQARLEEQEERLQAERMEQQRRFQQVLEEEQSRMDEVHRETMQELSQKHSEERERLSSMLEKLRTDIGEERRELEIHFSQRIKEVEARFSGDQEAVSERFQTDVRKLEQHYQSELAALAQRHAADRARWEEEMEAAVQEAEQQRRLLREALQLERESMIQEFTQEQERVEHSHAVDMEALREKNVHFQSELENFVSSAQTKEIELSRQLNELHNRLQENLEAKDTLLTHTECRAEELEQLLRQATDDFAQERAELQSSLSETEGQHAKTLLLVEKQAQERSDLLREQEELKEKMEEMEKILHQAVEDFHYERLELQGIVVALEEKVKEGVSMVGKKEEQRAILLAERDRLLLRVQQMESELGEVTRDMTISKQEIQELPLPDLPTKMGMTFLASSAENFIVIKDVCEDETADYHSEDFSVLGEDSPSAQDEEFEGEMLMQKESSGDFEDTHTISAHMMKICNSEVLNCPESVCIDSTNKIENSWFSEAYAVQKELDELNNFFKPGSTELFKVEEEEDHECLGSSDCNTSTDASIQTRVVFSEVGGLVVTNSVFKDKVDSDVRKPVEEFLGLGTGGTGLFESSEYDKSKVYNSPGHKLEEEEVPDEDKNAHCTTGELVAEHSVACINVNNAQLDGSGVNVVEQSTDFKDSTEMAGMETYSCVLSTTLYGNAEIIPKGELVETRSVCAREELVKYNLGADEGVEGDVYVTIDTTELKEAVKNYLGPAFTISTIVGGDIFSNMQDVDHTVVDQIETAVGIVAQYTNITLVQNPEEGDESRINESVVEDHARENETPKSAEVSRVDLAMTDDIEESNNFEVEAQLDAEASCSKASHTQDPEPMDEMDMKDETKGNRCIKPQDTTVDAEIGPMLKKQQKETPHDRDLCVQRILELQEMAVQFKDQSSLLEVLQDQYSSAVEQNLCLQEKLAQLQHHTDELELLLDLNKGSNGLRVELVTMVAQAKELEVKELELAELQRSYEECICENMQLADRNRRLEKRVQNLESKMHIVQEFHKQHSCLLDEIAKMREENAKLSTAVQELEKQDEMMLALQQIAESSDSSDDSFMDSSWTSGKMAAVSELEDCCSEFEKHNSHLRSALNHLQEKSLRIHERMQEHRNEAGRLAEENLILRQKISALKEEDLRENQHELLVQVEHFRKERNVAQKVADGLKRQISELQRRGQELEVENDALSQQNVKHALNVDSLQHTLEEVIRQHGNGLSTERRELENGEDFAVPLSRTEKLDEEKELLRAELNRCVEKMTRLRSVETQFAQLLNERQTADKHNQALRAQLIKAQEKVQALDSTLQGLTQQNSRLKSDLRITQQERDALKQDVISLHKKLQNANEKCRLVEMSIANVSSGSQPGKRVWAELSGLMETELTLLRKENERLQHEMNDARLELSSAREKGRQLEALVLSVKQQKQQNQASLAKAAEQERSALKREIDSLQTQLHNKLCDSTEEQREMESLQEENERLRNKQTILEAQLMEAQLIAMLPPSPLRLAAERRGQCHGDEMNPDINVQKEREVALLKMEERMKEVELTLRNVKLLLQEKVAQLKEQLHKNSKADVLIKDLYVENAQLLKALEMSEQRHKVAEKKNYLLEEKISSLNKIVRELSPSPLTPVPYHFGRS